MQACEERVIHDHEFELIKTTKIAIIIHRERILLTARILYSFSDITYILLSDIIIVIVFAEFLQFFLIILAIYERAYCPNIFSYITG